VQELANDGALMAVAINAACVALADAGIPMRQLFSEFCVYACVHASVFELVRV
jgi:ribonuclease PH